MKNKPQKGYCQNNLVHKGSSYQQILFQINIPMIVIAQVELRRTIFIHLTNTANES
jgi:hypothetical protein